MKQYNNCVTLTKQNRKEDMFLVQSVTLTFINKAM